MRIVHSTRANKPRQIREAQHVDAQAFHPPGEEHAWGTPELTEDMRSFVSYGGKTLRLRDASGKTSAVLESISMPALLKIARKYRTRFQEGSALRAIAGNASLLEKARRDYRGTPLNKIVYYHGVARLPNASLAGKGKQLMNRHVAALARRKPGSLYFGFIDCTSVPNERSLRVFLRNGYLIDDVAESVYSSKDLHVRIVKPPVAPQTEGEEKIVQMQSGPAFYSKARVLLADGFVGVGFDAKTRAVVFRKLKK